MAGFSFLSGNIKKYEHISDVVANRIFSGPNYVCYNKMIRKYEGDKIFFQNDDYLIVLDGVILNKLDLIKVNGNLDWKDVIIKLYKQSDTFFEAFRGSFSGLLYDKNSNKTLVFSDHIGTKFLYYIKLNDAVFISSMMAEIYLFLQQNNIPYSLNQESAYLLLSYGYMLENRTLCDKVMKIRPGCYLTIIGNKVEEKRYCLLDNTPDYSISEKDAIELIDREFRNAISLEFEKDKEYNYKHFVALSAGLDSRMTCWVAHEMGYSNQLNITFSQSNYWDEIVPKQISSDLKHEWLFKALDNGLWLYDVDVITKITGGNVLYYGLAHGNSLYKYMNFGELGMLHSGQLGDVVIGTFFQEKDQKKQFKLGDGAYSNRCLDKLKKIELENFANQEIAKFYYRGFNGANNGQVCEMEYNETCSPFMNWDFMNAILKIPVELRYNHYIYKKWILAKYPNAAKYVWEKIGCRIDRRYGIVKVGSKMLKVEDIPMRILKKCIGLNGFNDRNNMNPLGYYINYNKALQEYLCSLVATDIDNVKDRQLKNILMEMGLSNNPIERIQAVSLLSAIRLYFSEGK